MLFKATFLLSLLTSSLALPISGNAVEKRALSVQNYSQFTVSGGVAGNALAEVNAKFPINLSDPKSVSAEDVAILKAARVVAESAEVDAGGFNDAIKAAGGQKTTAGAALQRGKIKNKVLKLQLQVMFLTVEGAQGKDTAKQLAAEQKKLANNVKLDKEAAGKPSTAINFQGSSQP
ncbi:hypothetical protein QBC42DRAFT_316920 [Cladorrhinum samala]|uniref:Small secreted protein n=1 Tax=Cladorrhinum samala TaxID=585594 RepID=A0AAV9HVV8_9PEZI|nr:hypothetical protein QBC42DRAFT_316920 [Cladorrhinum samala]